ncbi:F0F1 ATP synthase subunit gamma [Caulobacter sp. NIBR2454]|uniref:F0F1 ATP synthase subunit gamma n=1 Tax=Caulobacter sp. NIBR2454 TaxID=3015996 RepID=UPI0022B66796|nr:F0F1 ATP synthase subunit gamma [Caulobacter sp. NIBR2454]
MASLKEMRNRISSVKATQKITKAMQMVAAAKLRRSQDAAESARPYATRLASVIANLSAGVSGDGPKLLSGTGSDQRHLVVVATSDRGLAGGFNSAIVRAAKDFASARLSEGKDVKIITVGKKARDPLRRVFGEERIVESFELSGQRTLTLASAQPVADAITRIFEAGEADVVTLFYSRYKSVVSQVPTARQLVPAAVESDAPAKSGEAVYTYEPSEEEILETLLPRYLTVQILSALLENQAGFYASQMSAMDNATRNAGDMIRRYTLEYNRTRQAQITKELIEIISGAEAI